MLQFKAAMSPKSQPICGVSGFHKGSGISRAALFGTCTTGNEECGRCMNLRRKAATNRSCRSPQPMDETDLSPSPPQTTREISTRPPSPNAFSPLLRSDACVFRSYLRFYVGVSSTSRGQTNGMALYYPTLRVKAARRRMEIHAVDFVFP
jgi:hypothetical protein